MSKDAAKAAKAIARRALQKSGAKQHGRGWNMAPAVKKLAKAKK